MNECPALIPSVPENTENRIMSASNDDLRLTDGPPILSSSEIEKLGKRQCHRVPRALRRGSKFFSTGVHPLETLNESDRHRRNVTHRNGMVSADSDPKLCSVGIIFLLNLNAISSIRLCHFSNAIQRKSVISRVGQLAKHFQ